MKRRKLIKQLAAAIPSVILSKHVGALSTLALNEPIAKGPFQPNWQSLMQYQTPEWFRDAKFGLWAHWGPQCQPEVGDWYARSMYMEGNAKNKFHLEKYGHPSVFGFKDVINEWKAEQWNPDELLSLYKKAGAKYFMALANHHDNFDLYDSKYQSWNSTSIGPKKDIIGGWANAARKNGLHFGVSVHAAHAWSWYETAQRSDKAGSYAGVPYDGKLTKADGKGKWWDGLDPQELYAQNHLLSEHSEDNNMIHKQWNWGNGVSVPSKSYCDKFLNRTIDLINKYSPDVVYFDDSQLPLWPISDAGLKIAAHLYNTSIKKHGSLQAVINGKILDENQRRCMVWDIERGQSNNIEPLPWQTDTCIGDWHYNRSVYDKHRYKSARTVIHTLIDVVSKNGNLLLSVPVRGNGTIDEDERKIVEEIGAWMQVNGDCIYGTRPWTVFGEGPAMETAAPLNAQGFNEGKNKPFTEEDIRFTAKTDAVYAICLGISKTKTMIKSMAVGKSKPVSSVTLNGTKQALNFTQTAEGLLIQVPENIQTSIATVFKIV